MKKDGGEKRGPFRSLPAGGGCLWGTYLPLLPPFLWLLPQLKAWVNELLRGEGANGEPKLPEPLMSGQGPAHRNTEHLPLLRAGNDLKSSKTTPKTGAWMYLIADFKKMNQGLCWWYQGFLPGGCVGPCWTLLADVPVQALREAGGADSLLLPGTWHRGEMEVT